MADLTPENPQNPAPGLDQAATAGLYQKVLAGKQLSTREEAALKRLEKDKEERLRWKFYQSIPQKHWRAMSGRQTKVINEQAARYGIPFGGPTINLSTVVRGLHDFLADNALKLSRDDDELMVGAGSPALERYREERALIARLERMTREGSVVPREEMRTALGRIAALLRSAGETLEREHGPEARNILDEALDDAEREIDQMFGRDAA